MSYSLSSNNYENNISTSLETMHLHNEFEYLKFLDSVITTFTYTTKDKKHLFHTDASNLFHIFLDCLPISVQQHYNCNTCKKFIKKYGDLVTVDEEGNLTSIMWEPKNTPDFYKKAVGYMKEAVESSIVTSVFISTKKEYGIRSTDNGFYHFYIKPSSQFIYDDDYVDQNKMIGVLSQRFNLLKDLIERYNLYDVSNAQSFFTMDLYRKDRFVKMLDWLEELLKSTGNKYESNINNYLWLEASRSTYCHLKNTVLGTVLDQLKEGCSTKHIELSYIEKMHPLNYQRPKKDPTIGNVNAANKLFEKLDLSKSLERRYATPKELAYEWKPKTNIHNTIKITTGVFSDLIEPKKEATRTNPNRETVTWNYFSKYVLPKADQIFYYTEDIYNSYCAYLTAVNEDAKPIIKWDDLDSIKNPVSWYLYNSGSRPKFWNLPVNTWVPVTGISKLPWMWFHYEQFKDYFSEGCLLLLKDAKDTLSGKSLGLFPEVLKNNLREYRQTIERYSNTHKLLDTPGDKACGVLISSTNNNSKYELKVISGNMTTIYIVDRWE